jgi:hypothetical protein
VKPNKEEKQEMKKILCILGMGLLMVGTAQAAVVTMSNLSGDGSSSGVTFDGGAVTETITLSTNGNNLVYSYNVTGLDLDGVGDTADTMSWDVVFSAFDESSVSVDGEVTLGTQVAAAYDVGEFNVGTDSTTWVANESIQFSVENIVLSDANYEATFDGFTSMWFSGGSYYVGTGADTTEFTLESNDAQTFSSAQEVLTLTAQASERNRNLTGSFSVTTAIPEPATIGMLGLGAFVTLMIRKNQR